jgi:hypothetical protein
MNRSTKTALLSVLFIIVAVLCYLLSIKSCPSPPLTDAEYRALIKPDKNELTAAEADRIPVHFQLQNLGRTAWTSSGKYPFFLTYHLLDEIGSIVQYDNRRFPLPHKVNPGRTAEMSITIRTPLEKGKYTLEFDLLREGLMWFKDFGSQTARISLWVHERRWPDEEYPLTLESSKLTRFRSNEPELNKIYKLIRLTLEKNQTGFEGKTGTVQGFSGGTDYPQIWLRDAATVIPASRYFYPSSYMVSWLEEHLAYQKSSGALEDWIDSQGKSDKNTTETDQESSAVHAAHQIYQMVGSEWLGKKISGKRIINRLESALQYVLDSRWNKEFGLVTGAHTADWGDVDMIDDDHKAVYADKKTHWTADIYDQSMFFQACLNLAEMLGALGETKKKEFWLERAQSLRQNADKWLWQEDKGFYRIHIHLDSLRHDFSEEWIFALGGNTQAILSGLSDELKSRRIIAQALRRQNYFHLSTISGTLLPPYPKGFFRHPLLDTPYEYQNGAQWDWFGGRFVYAMFENGFSRLAKTKMIEIFRKNIFNRGFFEWDSRDGWARGSDHYCGSAGSLSKVLFEGYFGIKLTKDSLQIQPRLLQDNARIHITVPAMDVFVAYDYRISPEGESMILRYNSNFAQTGKIKILIPWNLINRSNLSVIKDGIEHPFRLENVRNDAFVVIETDFADHTVQVNKKG